ncbi:MAG: outer membrane beta-barrel protein [Verrucomicrobiaceae bacterium]|nr:outer membrane beta-barrel protein [Verrucomicrobiaceae bacterium]
MISARAIFLFICLSLPAAAEIELKSLSSVKEGEGTKRKYGPYVGFFHGGTDSQSGKLTVGGLGYDLMDFDNGSTFGIEVGKSWRSKRWPLQASVEFEGSFYSGELGGKASEADVARMYDNGLHSFKTDMNAVFFMVNGSVALDLYRYRARLGQFISGLRPYVGGGIGGGQLWFRNTVTTSKAQSLAPKTEVVPSALGTPTGSAPATSTVATSTSFPFAMDDFVNAWQWYAGIEYSWKDKYSFYAEYREFHLGDMDELEEFFTKGYALGFRYRY